MLANPLIHSLFALSRSTDHFVAFRGDDRIQCEPGADRLAALVSPFVKDAVTKVEVAHYAPFKSEVKIYVCATNASYYRLTGQHSPATVTSKLFLSPDLFQGARPLDRYLSHELSHLHLVQRLGLFGSTRLPAWFKEGLAELVARGATGASVEVRDAVGALNERRSFIPDEGRNIFFSFLFPRYGSYWHIDNRTFYRQSMLFVQFMRDSDEDAFHRLLIAVERGDDFKKAFHDAYQSGVQIVWNKFLEKVRAMAAG